LKHIHQNIVSKITQNPETDAGQYLLSLTQELMRVRNEKEKHRWINTFYVIYDTYKNFINE
jgi:hypothetical protein